MDLGRAQRVRQKLDGARLRAMRCLRGLSLEEAAAALQLTPEAVAARELGSEPLLAAELWRFCRAVGVSVADAYLNGRRLCEPPTSREQRLQRKLLGAALATAREEAGPDLATASAAVGMDVERLRLGELGEVELTLAETEALAELYGVEPHSLFPAAPAPAPPEPRATVSQALPFPSDVSEFLKQAQSERYVRAAMALAQLDATTLGALEDALLFLRGG